MLFIAAISFYLLWWANAIHLLYWNEYDNNYAGAVVLIFIGQITFFIVCVYLVVSIVGAITQKAYRFLFLQLILVVLLPIIGLISYETIKENVRREYAIKSAQFLLRHDASYEQVIEETGLTMEEVKVLAVGGEID